MSAADNEGPGLVAGTRVLVVDDSAIVRHTVAGILEGLGFEVTEVADGKAALASLKEQSPAAVILDIHMPLKDGFDTLAELRADARWADLPVFILTSSPDAGFVRRAAALKVSGYLLKSELNRTDLGGRIGAVLDKAVAPPPKAQQTALRLNILLAHGNRGDHRDLAKVLAGWGCTILPTDNRAEALALTRANTIDAVLIEDQLRDTDGFRMAEALRAIDPADGARMPLILLTDRPLAEVKEAGERAGMDAYLAKPIDAGRLRTTLEGVSALRPEAPFDRQELMDRAGDDLELVHSMLDIFHRDTDLLLTGIAAAIEARNPTDVREKAHNFKGMLGTLAAHGVAETANQLEIASRTGDLAEAGQILLRLRQEAEALAKALEAEFRR